MPVALRPLINKPLSSVVSNNQGNYKIFFNLCDICTDTRISAQEITSITLKLNHMYVTEYYGNIVITVILGEI